MSPAERTFPCPLWTVRREEKTSPHIVCIFEEILRHRPGQAEGVNRATAIRAMGDVASTRPTHEARGEVADAIHVSLSAEETRGEGKVTGRDPPVTRKQRPVAARRSGDKVTPVESKECVADQPVDQLPQKHLMDAMQLLARGLNADQLCHTELTRAMEELSKELGGAAGTRNPQKTGCCII